MGQPKKTASSLTLAKETHSDASIITVTSGHLDSQSSVVSSPPRIRRRVYKQSTSPAPNADLNGEEPETDRRSYILDSDSIPTGESVNEVSGSSECDSSETNGFDNMEPEPMTSLHVSLDLETTGGGEPASLNQHHEQNSHLFSTVTDCEPKTSTRGGTDSFLPISETVNPTGDDTTLRPKPTPEFLKKITQRTSAGNSISAVNDVHDENSKAKADRRRERTKLLMRQHNINCQVNSRPQRGSRITKTRSRGSYPNKMTMLGQNHILSDRILELEREVEALTKSNKTLGVERGWYKTLLQDAYGI